MAVNISNLRRPHVSRLAFTILDAVKNEELDYFIAAVGLVLEAVCEEKKLSRSEIMTAVGNMLRTEGLADDNYVEALRSYIREEIATK
jgi:hypothetical protein